MSNATSQSALEALRVQHEKELPTPDNTKPSIFGDKVNPIRGPPDGSSIFEGMLTETDAARLLGLSVATLRMQRHKRRGIPFYKFGRRVLYRTSDLADYVKATRVEMGRP